MTRKVKQERSRSEEAVATTLVQGKVPLCDSAAAAEFSAAESTEMQSKLRRSRNNLYILRSTVICSFLLCLNRGEEKDIADQRLLLGPKMNAQLCINFLFSPETQDHHLPSAYFHAVFSNGCYIHT